MEALMKNGKKRNSVRMFQAMRPMTGPDVALARRGKTAADKARRAGLKGSRREVLAQLFERRHGL